MVNAQITITRGRYLLMLASCACFALCLACFNPHFDKFIFDLAVVPVQRFDQMFDC
jgi:hypothetical protein